MTHVIPGPLEVPRASLTRSRSASQAASRSALGLIRSAVTDAARHFGVTAVRDDHPAARCTSLRLPAPYPLTHGRRNPIAAWLDELGELAASGGIYADSYRFRG